MPASEKKKREKGKSYGESTAHNRKDCPEKSMEQVNTREVIRVISRLMKIEEKAREIMPL
jgi:hypothetical protein